MKVSKDQPSGPEPTKDGFDLIDYPCDYQFKAMVRVSGLDSGQSAQEVLRKYVLQQVSSVELLEVSTNASRSGRFESVSLTVRLQDRAQLEAVYQSLAAHPQVVMTL